MKKLSFYGLQVKGSRKIVHRFDYLDNLRAWIDEIGKQTMEGEWRHQLYASGPEVRRIQRRIAAGEEVVFPVEVTP